MIKRTYTHAFIDRYIRTIILSTSQIYEQDQNKKIEN